MSWLVAVLLFCAAGWFWVATHRDMLRGENWTVDFMFISDLFKRVPLWVARSIAIAFGVFCLGLAVVAWLEDI